MKRKHLAWIRWCIPVGLAVVGLFLLLTALGGRSVADRPAPSPNRSEAVASPSTQEEALWAAVGLNDAWHIAHGYTEGPLPSARSRSRSIGSQDSRDAFQRRASADTDTPQLVVDPRSVAFYAYADQPRLLSATVSISNGGGGTLRWFAQLGPGDAFTPTLVPTNGLGGENLMLTVNSALYTSGTLGITHTRYITISAAPSHTLDSPQVLSASLYVDPHPPRLWLDTNEILFLGSAITPSVYSRAVAVRNAGGYTLSWHTRAVSMGVTPLVTPTSGIQDGLITITVDARGYPATSAVYTGQVIVTATSGAAHVLPVTDAYQEIMVRLQTALHSAHLPQVIKQEPTPTPTPSPMPSPPPSPEEVRAIWIHRYDWTSLYGSESPADIVEMVSHVASAGFNTIFFQVRAHGDAYYTPGLEPWSARLNDDGALGQDPGWDPLQIMIDQAHAQGIQVQAYINVYPVWFSTPGPPADTVPEHPFWTWSHAYTWDDWRHWHRTLGVMKLTNGQYLWASPGVDGVRDHIVAVVNNIVERYAVDGVHLDLVRYANSTYSYDPISNAAAGSAETPARDLWQRERVTDLVRRIYTSIGEIRPEVRLSAAVWFCYYADGCGYGLSSGFADYYQDSLGWLQAGAIDAIAPMLYEWSGFDQLEIWRDVMLQFQNANAGRDVYPGISGGFDDFAEIAKRIQAARDAGTAGHAVFSYRAIDTHGYWDDFANGPYAQPAILAPLPWRNEVSP